MRTKKMRLVSALLALAMLFVMMPVGAFADDDHPVSGKCGANANGDNITWKLTKNNDTVNDGYPGWTLTLEGSGEMADYKLKDTGVFLVNTTPWNWAVDHVTQVEIPATVTHIGNYAFYDMFNTENITIPYGVETIGDCAFEDYEATKLVLPGSVTRIGKGAFTNCRYLEEVELSKSLTDIGDGAFSNCSALEQIDIPEGGTTIGTQAFSGCALLSSINIPNSVTNIGAMAFANCMSLKNVTIPSSVTSIEMGTFSGCMSLNSIAIPSSVTTIGDDAFALCVTLKEITIPQQVEKVGAEAFTGCAQLEKIDIESGSNLTTVGDHAFETTNYYLYGRDYGNMSDILSDMQDTLDELHITVDQLAETKIYCGAPLKKSGLLSDKGVAEENIIASVTVKLVDGEKTETWNVPYGGTYGETVGTLEQPTKEGYTFVDWYDENGEVFDPAAPLTEDTTIHAEWKKNAAPAPTPTPAPAPAPVDDDSVDAGAVAATVVLGAGTAALAYHIGTELYAEQVLGKGVAVPTLRGDVARKAWELAGKPAVTVAGNEAPDEDAQAQQWVVDQGLMKDRKDGKFHPEQWMSKLKALRTLDAAKKLG